MPTMVPDRGDNPRRKVNFYDAENAASGRCTLHNS
jgi:hypothetical protein